MKKQKRQQTVEFSAGGLNPLSIHSVWSDFPPNKRQRLIQGSCGKASSMSAATDHCHPGLA